MHIKQERDELESRAQKIKTEAEKEVKNQQQVKKTVVFFFFLIWSYLTHITDLSREVVAPGNSLPMIYQKLEFHAVTWQEKNG